MYVPLARVFCTNSHTLGYKFHRNSCFLFFHDDTFVPIYTKNGLTKYAPRLFCACSCGCPPGKPLETSVEDPSVPRDLRELNSFVLFFRLLTYFLKAHGSHLGQPFAARSKPRSVSFSDGSGKGRASTQSHLTLLVGGTRRVLAIVRYVYHDKDTPQLHRLLVCCQSLTLFQLLPTKRTKCPIN